MILPRASTHLNPALHDAATVRIPLNRSLLYAFLNSKIYVLTTNITIKNGTVSPGISPQRIPTAADDQTSPLTHVASRYCTGGRRPHQSRKLSAHGRCVTLYGGITRARHRWPRGRDLRDTFTPAFNQIRRRRMHLPSSLRHLWTTAAVAAVVRRYLRVQGAASWRYRTSPNSRPAVRRRSAAGHCELRCYRRNPWRASLVYRTGFKKDGGENKAVSWICRERTAKTVNCCNYSYFV